MLHGFSPVWTCICLARWALWWRMFGHMSLWNSRDPVCAFCAGSHPTNDCYEKRLKGEPINLKCKNCQAEQLYVSQLLRRWWECVRTSQPMNSHNNNVVAPPPPPGIPAPLMSIPALPTPAFENMLCATYTHHTGPRQPDLTWGRSPDRNVHG